MGRASRESIMTALYETLIASVQESFTATTTLNSPILTNVSTTAGLFLGLPVFGTSVPRGAVITSLSPLTLSLPATGNTYAAALSTGFLTTGRRLKFWTDVAEQPALFLRDGDEELDYPQEQGVLQLQTLKPEIWIYSNAGQNPDLAPATGLNNLLDAVQAAFAPDSPQTGRFTLGGLVFWCRLNGKVTKEPGDLDGQAIAIAEVEITVP